MEIRLRTYTMANGSVLYASVNRGDNLKNIGFGRP